MLLLLMFAVVVLCSPAGVLLGTAWLSYTAEDGAADTGELELQDTLSAQLLGSVQTTLCRKLYAGQLYAGQLCTGQLCTGQLYARQLFRGRVQQTEEL